MKTIRINAADEFSPSFGKSKLKTILIKLLILAIEAIIITAFVFVIVVALVEAGYFAVQGGMLG